MNYGKLFAYVQVALAFGACIGYCSVKDYRRAVYWFFAAGITLSVTW